MSTDEDQLAVAGEFGEKVAAFLESEIGRYLEQRAQIEEEQAAAAMLELDPWEFTELTVLQNHIARIQEKVVMARNNQGYLADAIVRGQDADNLLMSREDQSYE